MDEAVKPRESRAGEEGQGQQAGAFPKPCQGSAHPPAPSLAAELGKHLPARLGGLGTPFAGRAPSAQPMVLTSPTEGWEGASICLPSIAPLPGSSSTKGCKSPLKQSWCVCVGPGDTPPFVTLSPCCNHRVLLPGASGARRVPEVLLWAASLSSLLRESSAPSPGKEPQDTSRVTSPAGGLQTCR